MIYYNEVINAPSMLSSLSEMFFNSFVLMEKKEFIKSHIKQNVEENNENNPEIKIVLRFFTDSGFMILIIMKINMN